MFNVKKFIASLLSALLVINFIIFNYATAADFSSLLDFTDDITVTSMLPLEEKKAYLVVGDHDGAESISAVPVQLVLDNLLDSDGNHIKIPENAKVVWSYYKDLNNNVISDDYFVLDEGGTLDLSIFEEYNQYVLEMIIGDGNQLNPDNVRYIVTVYLSDAVRGMRTYDLYTQDENGIRYEIVPVGVSLQASAVQIAGMKYSVRNFIVPDHKNGIEYYLGVNSQLDEHPFIKLDVITFDEYYKYMLAQASGQEYEYSTINNQILNQNMNKTDAGYKTILDSAGSDDLSSVLNNALYFIYKNESNNEIIRMDCMKFVVDNNFSYFTDEAYDEDYNNVQLNTSEVTVSAPSSIQLIGSQVVNTNALIVNRVWLKKGYSPDDEYYYRLNAQSKVWENANSHVVKAVLGIYDSPASAADAEDIKDQLIPADDSVKGYKANYAAENEVYFTVFFDDDSVFQFWVIFNEYNPDVDMDYIREYSDVPIVGEADPWFKITGAKDSDGNVLDTYIIENGKNINIDTMYGYGYQSVFINDNPDSIEPTFWVANSDYISIESIYVNGRRFNVGDKLSFPEGENSLDAVFSVIINDSKGKHTKNYNVSFIKKSQGPKLYVAGPLSPDVRSVFLDEYFEYKHDIFIANIGGEALSNLRLELDAENVALDSYWTIGGEGNDMLLPCSENFKAELESTKYGELSNVAKIRLIPDGENSGEIDGTLKIYSGSELLETITLSGRAQNPEIITSEVDDAVLYVPYSYLITTNNMYDWTDVDFELTGNLPRGVEFYSSTGEIYGVPLETGEFTFDITANFKSDTYSFDSSTVSYTMKVKDNTNYNVYTATDDEYTLLDTIGTDVGEYDFVLNEISNELFRSEGVLDQFVGLWLNGELLEKGVDYEAESGSTKITIYAQTFENKANQDGINTIAAEFRISDTNSLNTADNKNELKVTAQNFRLDLNSVSENLDVTCSVKVLEPSGNVIRGLRLELRSTPQNAITNASGIAIFNPIEFGEHTLYVKNENDTILAQKNFEILSGNKYNVTDDVVTAVKGSSFILNVEYDGNKLKLLSSDENNNTQVENMNTDSENSIYDMKSISSNKDNNVSTAREKADNISDTVSISITSPYTGDEFDIMKWILLSFSAIILLIGSVVCKKRKS